MIPCCLVLILLYSTTVVIAEDSDFLTNILENVSDKACLKKNNIDLKSILLDFIEQLQTFMKSTAISKFQTHDDLQGLESFVVVICKSPFIPDRIKDLNNTLVKCLNKPSIQFRMVSNTLKSLKAACEAACENNGRLFIDCVDDEFEYNCLKKSQIHLTKMWQQCSVDLSRNMLNTLLPMFNRTGHNVRAFADILSDLFTAAAKGCSMVLEFKDCLLSAFDICEGDATKEFMTVMVNSFLRNTYIADICDNFI